MVTRIIKKLFMLYLNIYEYKLKTWMSVKQVKQIVIQMQFATILLAIMNVDANLHIEEMVKSVVMI
jgi:hypothetical protein